MIRHLSTLAILLAWCLPVAAGEPDLVGVIVDEAGLPVAGASVLGMVQGKSVEVAADGAGGFRIPMAGEGPVWGSIRVKSADGRLGVLAVRQEKGKRESVKVVLRPAREVVVKVVDGQGKPVAGAEVDFLDTMALSVEGLTDAEGRWRGKVAADSVNWSILARKGGLGFDYASGERARNSKDQPLPLPSVVNLTLDGVKPVRVKVVDREGKPLPGAIVWPWLIHKPGHETDMNLGGSMSRMPVTNRDGLATIDWMPDQPGRQRSILVHLDHYYATDGATWLPADKVVEDVTITLNPTERLAGRITFADGRPAADASVVIEGQGAGDNAFSQTVRADADGRYEVEAFAEQCYILAASLGEFAAPYRTDILLRAGKPATGVDLVLSRATKVRGRVTVGKDDRPASSTYVTLIVDKGEIPSELKREGDRFSRPITMRSSVATDESGRYEFAVGAGEYQIQGPPRVDPARLTIPSTNPPAEVVIDFKMPRAETGPFAATVVDDQGKPVVGATVGGMYASAQARSWFHQIKTDDQGKFRTQRSLDPLVLHATSADGKFSGVVRSEAEATDARIVLGPTATVSGRLLETGGKLVPKRKLTYGIRVFMGEDSNSPWTVAFGGNVETDDQGRFSIAGLVPGEEFVVNLPTDAVGSSKTVTTITAKNPGPFSIGDVEVDTRPYVPYVPPTVQQRTAEAFEARKAGPPRDWITSTLAEAKREATRPLVLFGQAGDPACIELFRLFNEEAPEDDPTNPRPRTPGELRWEFELASFDTTRPDVRELATDLKTDQAEGRPPCLIVLNLDGSAAARFELRLNASGKLDSPELGRFLAAHKLATRDAETMLADALARAKAEDKRVFFIASASWCGPCRLLARFLDPRKAELERQFVFVKLDVSRDLHGQSVRDRYKESANGGVPWYAILDEAGQPMVTSNLPDKRTRDGSTNIGFPSSPKAVAHFVEMLRRTAPRLSAETLEEVGQALLKK